MMSASKPYVLLRVGNNIVGTAKYFTGPSNDLRRTLYGSPLSQFAKLNEDLVVIWSVQVFSEFYDVPYPYAFGGTEAPPKLLGDLNHIESHFKSFIAWDNSDLVPHEAGCDLKDSPLVVSEQSFLNGGDLHAGRGLNTARLQGIVDDRSDQSGDIFEIRTADNSVNKGGVPQNNGIVGTEPEPAGDDPQEIYTAPEAAEGTFRPERMLNKPSTRRFSRLKKNSTNSCAPHFTQPNVQPCADELLTWLDPHNDSSHAFESIHISENDKTQNVDSGSLAGPEEAHSLSERSSIPDEADHARAESQEEHGRTQNESHLQDTDDSSCDSSVELESCSHTLPFPNKRAYVYRKRKKRVPEGNRDVPKRRKLLSQRMDNPFLRSGLHCCKSKRCYDNTDPTYAFKTYKELMAMNREDFKSFLISIYDSQEHTFKMLGRPVCAQYLQKGFGFSNDLQCSVKNTPNARAGPTSLALPRDVRRITKKDCIISFLRNYADACGDMMPNALFTNLPDAGRLDVYEKFKKGFKKHYPSETPPVTSFFYAIWKGHCTGIRLRRNHGFARCEICVLLKSEIAENQKNGSIVRQATKSLRKHLDLVMEERRMYQNRCQRAIRYPKKYTSIVVDGADQKAYGLPHFLDKSKADRGHKFKVKCVGCLKHRASKKLWMYVMTEEFLTGANHIIEVIHRVLAALKAEAGRLTEVLYVQVDNCTRENKNRYFFGYLELLVALGVYLEVEVSFLPVGHTHTDIDQAFSVVSRILSRTNAGTMTELIAAIDSCYLGKASALRLDRIVNFSGLCEQTKCLVDTRSLGGIMHLRYFRFTRAAGDMLDDGVFKTQCHVKVQFVEDWQPLSISTTRGFLKHIPNLRETPPPLRRCLPTTLLISTSAWSLFTLTVENSPRVFFQSWRLSEK